MNILLQLLVAEGKIVENIFELPWSLGGKACSLTCKYRQNQELKNYS